jgi:methyl-accepting chemotaxis protein
MLTLSPVLLTLCGLLLAALSALLAGGIAWGRFASALDQLRDDHKGLRADLKAAVEALTGVAVLRQRVEQLEGEVRDLRTAKHTTASTVTRLEAELEQVRRTADRATDAVHDLAHTPHGVPR